MKNELKRLLDPAVVAALGRHPLLKRHAYVAPQPPAVVKAATLVLSVKFSAEQGFQRIVDNCLAQIQGNQAGVERGSDPESVHQMRVGLRRLRSALDLFAQLAPCPAALQAELEWLTSALGAARDWEVLAGSTLRTGINAGPDQTALAQLQQAAQAQARRHRQQAAHAVASERYARLLLALGGWVSGARWRGLPASVAQNELQTPLARFAAQMLARCHAKLHKRGKQLRRKVPPTASETGSTTAAQARHRLRIAAKKVRYATEFFQSLYPARRVRPYVNALTGLQDALGALNDVAVADGLLRQLAHGHPELAYSAGCVQGYLSARTERDIRKLGKLWRQFSAIKLPCRKD